MTEPIRVLQIVTTMNRGGLETMLMNYYRNIDRTRVQFDFVEHRPERSAYDDEIEALGGRIYRLPTLVPWSCSYRSALQDLFRQHPEYQIVHVHQDCLSSVALEEAAKAGISARIAHSHNASQDKNLKYPIKLYYRRNIPKYATGLLACSKDAGDWMFGGAPFEILNNAIPAKQYVFDPEVRPHIRRELGLGDSFTLGLVGRFSPQKNHVFLLEVFRAVLQVAPTAKLLLVGDGALRPHLEQKISELGLSNRVILTGVRADVPSLLQAMDVFVFPSNYEGLGIAAVEAQAAGLPCFISDRVPIECKKTNLVTQLPLSATPEHWAAEVLAAKNTPRRNTFLEIAGAGFDVERNAAFLQQYYLSKAGQ